MIITLRSRLETDDRMPCEKYRRVLSISRNGVGIYDQHKFRSNDEWCGWRPWLAINITRHFYLGRDHFWYDGPHCFFSLGFVHVVWSGGLRTGACKKCDDEREDV